MPKKTTLQLTTSINPGAIALLQLRGENVIQILEKLTLKKNFKHSVLYLCQFRDIDEGIVAYHEDKYGQWAQLMPHGGPRVVQRLIKFLLDSDVVIEKTSNTKFPEANSSFENDMLHAMATAASPRAIPLLASQKNFWREISAIRNKSEFIEQSKTILARTRVLDKLSNPPRVVIVGKPNVGKSTLSNFIFGKNKSIVADLPGTTRDWVAGLAQLQDITVQWIDTPGVHSSDDQTEQQAISLAKTIIAQSDVLVSVGDKDNGWLNNKMLSRKIDILVKTKSDLNEIESDIDTSNVINISGKTGRGIATLTEAILTQLELKNKQDLQAWAFNDKLKNLLNTNDQAGLRNYLDL